MQSFPTLIGGYVYLEDVDTDETKRKNLVTDPQAPKLRAENPKLRRGSSLPSLTIMSEKTVTG